MPKYSHTVALIIITAFALYFLTGCVSRIIFSADDEPQYTYFYTTDVLDIPEETPGTEAGIEAGTETGTEAGIEAVPEVHIPVPFSVLYSANEITGALYEPTFGAYLGAWLSPHISKGTFEEMADKKHAVFTMEMCILDEFPTTWILQSIAAQAAPLIILHMPHEEDYSPGYFPPGYFPLEELTDFAYELGNFNLPAFIVFNPLASGTGISPEDYILLFRYARIIFRTYAPMAAFVWHGYGNTATPDSPFYPGHDAVDWVSLEALAPQGADGFIVDIPAYLKPFYLSFQLYKPIILLPVGVGHFSRRDYVYRIPQAAAEITRVYKALRDSFPRVRMIIYGDHSMPTPKQDDFSLTREEALMQAYSAAISDSHFISRLIPGNTDGPLLMRSALHGYYYQGEVFLDRGILEAGPHRPIPAATKEINGRMFVSTNDINWMKVAADHARRVIYIQ